MGCCEPSHKSFELRLSNNISAVQLAQGLKSLSLETVFDDGEERLNSAELHANSIGELLARATDKDASKAFLDDLSINQLLALNRCKLRDCALSELVRRDEICARLDERKEMHEFVLFSQIRLTSVGKSYENLYQYCEFVVDDCKKWCVGRQEALASQASKKLKFFDKRRVKLFQKEVIAHSENNADLHGAVDYKKAVRSVFDRRNEPERVRLESSCHALVSILNNVHQVKSDESSVDTHNRSGWTAAYKLCRIVGSLVYEDSDAESTNDASAGLNDE